MELAEVSFLLTVDDVVRIHCFDPTMSLLSVHDITSIIIIIATFLDAIDSLQQLKRFCMADCY